MDLSDDRPTGFVSVLRVDSKHPVEFVSSILVVGNWGSFERYFVIGRTAATNKMFDSLPQVSAVLISLVRAAILGFERSCFRRASRMSRI